jgi:DNA-binding transcriptional regulator YiaG
LVDIHTVNQIIALNEPAISEERKLLYQTPVFINLQPLFKSSIVSYPSTTQVIETVSNHVLNGRYFDALNTIDEFLFSTKKQTQPLFSASTDPAVSNIEAPDVKKSGNMQSVSAPCTQAQKAEMFGVSERTVRNWESERTPAPPAYNASADQATLETLGKIHKGGKYKACKQEISIALTHEITIDRAIPQNPTIRRLLRCGMKSRAGNKPETITFFVFLLKLQLLTP